MGAWYLTYTFAVVAAAIDAATMELMLSGLLFPEIRSAVRHVRVRMGLRDSGEKNREQVPRTWCTWSSSDGTG